MKDVSDHGSPHLPLIQLPSRLVAKTVTEARAQFVLLTPCEL